jgi:hypothetical protein
LLTLLVLLAGCMTGPRLYDRPSSTIDLSGNWVIDPAASDDAAALVRAALPHPKVRPKARYDMWGNELPEGVDPGPLPPGTERGDHRRAGTNEGSGRQSRNGSRDIEDAGTYGYRETPPVWGRMSGFEFLSFFATPSQHLKIDQESGQVRIANAGRVRVFVPGEVDPVNVTDRYGSRAMRGGWVGDAFVVSSSDGRHVSVEDSVRRLRDDRLERTIVTHVTGVKSIQVRAVYRRIDEGEVSATEGEGPPSPLR